MCTKLLGTTVPRCGHFDQQDPKLEGRNNSNAWNCKSYWKIRKEKIDLVFIQMWMNLNPLLFFTWERVFIHPASFQLHPNHEWRCIWADLGSTHRCCGVGEWLWNIGMLPSCATDMSPYRRDVPLSLFFACIWCIFFSVQKLKQGSAQAPKGFHIINTNSRKWLWTWRTSQALQQPLHPDLQEFVMNSRWLLFWKDWACFKFNQ